MKKLSGLFIITMLTLSLAALFNGCGGGSSPSTSRGGGTDATLTASNAPQVGDAVTQAVKLVAPTSALGNLKTSSISPKEQPPLMSILDTVLSAYRNSVQGKHISALYTYKKNCTNGDITVNVTSVDPLKKLIHADIDVSSCTVGTQTLNGTMGVDYIVGSIDALTNPTLENLKNFEKVTITTSGFTYVNTTSNDNLTLTDLTLVLQDFTYNGDIPIHGSITLGGTVTGTIDGEAINIGCDSFGLSFIVDDAGGIAVSISGRIMASCLGGWISTVTNQPVFLAAHAHCPTSGEIVVSAGGNSVTMHVEASSKIDIFFNGTLVQTYDDCSKVIGLCTG